MTQNAVHTCFLMRLWLKVKQDILDVCRKRPIVGNYWPCLKSNRQNCIWKPVYPRHSRDPKNQKVELKLLHFKLWVLDLFFHEIIKSPTLKIPAVQRTLQNYSLQFTPSKFPIHIHTSLHIFAEVMPPAKDSFCNFDVFTPLYFP